MRSLLTPTNSELVCSVCGLSPQAVWQSDLSPQRTHSYPGGGRADPGLHCRPREGGEAGENATQRKFSPHCFMQI